jgi:hypothetical protein
MGDINAVLLQIVKNKNTMTNMFYKSNSKPEFTVTVLAQTDEDAPKIDRPALVNLVSNDTNTIFLKKNNDEPIRLTSSNILYEINNVDIFTIPTTSVNTDTSSDTITSPLHIGGKTKTRRKTIRKKSYKKSARRNLTRRS